MVNANSSHGKFLCTRIEVYFRHCCRVFCVACNRAGCVHACVFVLKCKYAVTVQCSSEEPIWIQCVIGVAVSPCCWLHSHAYSLACWHCHSFLQSWGCLCSDYKHTGLYVKWKQWCHVSTVCPSSNPCVCLHGYTVQQPHRQSLEWLKLQKKRSSWVINARPRRFEGKSFVCVC